ncbi:hypothetical protein [Roseicella sp. DB1501]|uniref:hypothetical protein n=1 Tax=Roseicella sp. DB1501 TaxID=2730925 RepID=UPI001490DC02|nr:hypothetical protein [Roseicella sp. DB1501]NOG70428.1 hypothetical protein [Roseicella sp. DB1501]
MQTRSVRLFVLGAVFLAGQATAQLRGAPSEARMDPVTVTLTPGADLDRAAAALEAQGVVIEQRLHQLGILIGKAPATQIDQLRTLPEIADISGEHQVHTQGK